MPVQSYYEKYTTAKDEWTLSEAIAADPKSGGLEAFLTKHYDTFIVRTFPQSIDSTNGMNISIDYDS